MSVSRRSRSAELAKELFFDGFIDIGELSTLPLNERCAGDRITIRCVDHISHLCTSPSGADLFGRGANQLPDS
jgi:hypothetical protein